MIRSGSLLDSLDAEERDEEGETERGRFISAHIEIIAKICLLHPDDILAALLPQLKSSVSAAALTQDSAEHRNCGTLIQITGRLVEHFLGERFLTFHDRAGEVLGMLLDLGERLTAKGQLEVGEKELLQQCVSCMRPFQHWLRSLWFDFFSENFFRNFCKFFIFNKK